MMPKHLENYWAKRLAKRIDLEARDRYVSRGIYIGAIITMIQYLIARYC